eukprot:2467296-Rhodomonas_salina.2
MPARVSSGACCAVIACWASMCESAIMACASGTEAAIRIRHLCDVIAILAIAIRHYRALKTTNGC